MTFAGLLILVSGLVLMTVATIPSVNHRIRGLLNLGGAGPPGGIHYLSGTAKPGGIHYAWIIVAVLALVQIVGVSINMAGGVLVEPLSDSGGDFGFSIASIGASYGLYFLMGALLAPLAGWLGDRYGARSMMLAGGIMFGVVLALVGFISQPWHLLLTFGLLRGAAQSIFMVPLMAAVSGWFRRRLGLGIGILWAAGGVGPAVMSPLLTFLIGQIGWQATFWVIGGVGGVLIAFLASVFRNQPADIGIRPYGAMEGDDSYQVRDASIERLRTKIFNQHIRRTRAFWNLISIHGLGCAGHGIILVFAVPLAISRDVEPVTAALMLTIISLVSIPSRFLTPVLAEIYGTKKIMATCLLVQGLSVLFLFWAQDAWVFFVFSAVFGLGFGGEWTGYLVINRQYFGHGPLGTCYGWQMTGALLGHAFVSLIAGIVVDVTGSYMPVIALSMVTSLGGVVVIFMLEPTTRVLIPHWEEALPVNARSSIATAAAD